MTPEQIERAEKVARQMKADREVKVPRDLDAEAAHYEVQEERAERARWKARERWMVESTRRFERYRQEAIDWLIEQGEIPAHDAQIVYERWTRPKSLATGRKPKQQFTDRQMEIAIQSLQGKGY